VLFLEEIDIPELTSEQVEELSKAVEEKTREYITARVPRRQIDRLDITVEAEGTKPVMLTISVAIELIKMMKNMDVRKLANDAVGNGLNVAQEFLRKLICQFQK
jgi:hypothetical protein